MKILTNLEDPPSVAYNTPVFPEGAFLAVTTDDPDHTQFITVEIFSGLNLEEVAQIDPEFEHDKIVVLKIQRQGISLKGKAKLRINWADDTGQEFSQETILEII